MFDCGFVRLISGHFLVDDIYVTFLEECKKNSINLWNKNIFNVE